MVWAMEYLEYLWQRYLYNTCINIISHRIMQKNSEWYFSNIFQNNPKTKEKYECNETIKGNTIINISITK